MPMVFEQGPYLTVAALCDKALQEKDGVISLIRVVDKLTSSAVGPDAPEQMPPFPVNHASAASALYCGLARREDARHGRTGQARCCRRRHRRSVTAGTAHLRKAGRPGVGQEPRRFPLGPGGAHRSHAFLLDYIAFAACVRATGPALGVPEARP